MDLPGKVVLVTGASSGIGRECAMLFGQAGCLVALTARRADRLAETAAAIRQAGGTAEVFLADLARPEAPGQLAAAVLERFGRVDVLVNNAGFGRLDWLDALDPAEDISPQMQVNLLAVIQLTRALLPEMLARSMGMIINIGSIASFIPTPMYSIYDASKFGLRGFTSALRREVRARGVRVVGVYPGFVDTEFILHIGRLAKLGSRTPRIFWLTSAQVAHKIVTCARRPRRSVVMPWYMTFAAIFDALFPGIVDAALEWMFVRPELDRTFPGR